MPSTAPAGSRRPCLSTTALLVSRRHVDLLRVCSALCRR
ncbi:MAG: putative leader peptide [Kineosporiaceae bacterium]